MKIFAVGVILLSTIVINILPVHTLSKSNVIHAKTLSPSSIGQKSMSIAQAATFPVHGNQKDKILKKGFMETTFNLNSNGNLNAETKMSNMAFTGFYGGVFITFTDASGSPIWSTEQQMNSIHERSAKISLTSYWQSKVPPDILSRISGYAIYQGDPIIRYRPLDWLRSPEGRAKIKGIVHTIRKS